MVLDQWKKGPIQSCLLRPPGLYGTAYLDIDGWPQVSPCAFPAGPFALCLRAERGEGCRRQSLTIPFNCASQHDPRNPHNPLEMVRASSRPGMQIGFL